MPCEGKGCLQCPNPCAPCKPASRRRIAELARAVTPGARNCKTGLIVGEADADGKPDLEKLRLCAKNKSVTTTHRNQCARFDDLNQAPLALHNGQAEAIVVATFIIGVAERVLNVPDRVMPVHPERLAEFNERVVPRLIGRRNLLNGVRVGSEHESGARRPNRRGFIPKSPPACRLASLSHPA